MRSPTLHAVHVCHVKLPLLYSVIRIHDVTELERFCVYIITRLHKPRRLKKIFIVTDL